MPILSETKCSEAEYKNNKFNCLKCQQKERIPLVPEQTENSYSHLCFEFSQIEKCEKYFYDQPNNKNLDNNY